MTTPPTSDQTPHRSVLYQQIILGLRPISSGFYVDATLGAGGHAWGILDASAPSGRLLGLDVDPQALAIARQRLSVFQERSILVQASYTTLPEQVHQQGWEAVNGIVFDLGVSSMQIDTPERGFSFMANGPLDMRFSPDQFLSAADIINKWSETQIADLIWRYGEEPHSRRIARAIIQARPINTTHELAEVILHSNRGKRGPIHPATRAFQAIRIAVNDELQSIEEVLPKAVEILTPGGRLAVISFHSLEDRLVKQFMRRESRDCICPPGQPVCTCNHRASILEITRHPIQPEEGEIELNPRARSARLRIAEKR